MQIESCQEVYEVRDKISKRFEPNIQMQNI